MNQEEGLRDIWELHINELYNIFMRLNYDKINNYDFYKTNYHDAYKLLQKMSYELEGAMLVSTGDFRRQIEKLYRIAYDSMGELMSVLSDEV